MTLNTIYIRTEAVDATINSNSLTGDDIMNQKRKNDQIKKSTLENHSPAKKIAETTSKEMDNDNASEQLIKERIQIENNGRKRTVVVVFILKLFFKKRNRINVSNCVELIPFFQLVSLDAAESPNNQQFFPEQRFSKQPLPVKELSTFLCVLQIFDNNFHFFFFSKLAKFHRFTETDDIALVGAAVFRKRMGCYELLLPLIME